MINLRLFYLGIEALAYAQHQHAHCTYMQNRIGWAPWETAWAQKIMTNAALTTLKSKPVLDVFHAIQLDDCCAFTSACLQRALFVESHM